MEKVEKVEVVESLETPEIPEIPEVEEVKELMMEYYPQEVRDVEDMVTAIESVPCNTEALNARKESVAGDICGIAAMYTILEAYWQGDADDMDDDEMAVLKEAIQEVRNDISELESEVMPLLLEYDACNVLMAKAS